MAMDDMYSSDILARQRAIEADCDEICKVIAHIKSESESALIQEIADTMFKMIEVSKDTLALTRNILDAYRMGK